METFEVKRGVVKKVTADGGLPELAARHFSQVEATGENAFEGSHAIMSAIKGEYSPLGKLVVDVTNEVPNFDDPDAMAEAMEARKRWSAFLDEATGYNAKQRGDKAKEWAKKKAKAQGAIKQARHFMDMTGPKPEVVEAAEKLIAEIEALLEQGENSKAESRGAKLGKMLEE